MDNQSFRDMCAAMTLQGFLMQNAPWVRDSQALARRSFEIAEAMVWERERIDAAAKAARAAVR